MQALECFIIATTKLQTNSTQTPLNRIKEMSHFSVIVIGDNVEAQLQPFHEYESTGIEDQFVKDIDVTEDTLADFKKHGSEGETLSDFAEGWNGAEERDGKFYNRTNPNAKWDWWVIGGRWSNWFNIDQGKLADFDFSKTTERKKQEAIKLFDDIEKATKGIDPIGTWESVRERFKDNIGAARDYRNNHDWIKAIRSSDNDSLRWADTPEDIFDMGREKYIELKVDSACVPFAFVKDSVWHEKGEMGWFAISTNEKETSVWHDEFDRMMKGLSLTTQLTVVDCHI